MSNVQVIITKDTVAGGKRVKADKKPQVVPAKDARLLIAMGKAEPVEPKGAGAAKDKE